MEVAGLLVTETEFTELPDEIVIELTALFDTLTEFPESLDDTVMEVAGLLDTETKFTKLLDETNVGLLDTGISTELLDDREAAETTGDIHFTDGTLLLEVP